MYQFTYYNHLRPQLTTLLYTLLRDQYGDPGTVSIHGNDSMPEIHPERFAPLVRTPILHPCIPPCRPVRSSRSYTLYTRLSED